MVHEWLTIGDSGEASKVDDDDDDDGDDVGVQCGDGDYGVYGDGLWLMMV